MEERLPVVFISSTFFDLRQVRADLAEFIETQLGYRFLASEHVSFPVDPALDTIENCKKRVENDADVFILIIGGRYGSVPSGGVRSVTNMEYLAARAKRLPIFVFIHRDILALLPVWEKNPEADYSTVVDTPKLFDFIAQIRSSDRVWTFPFDTAQEIRVSLRSQLAFQMARGLRLVSRLNEDVSSTNDLRGEALRIVLERENGWAPRLLAQLIDDGIRAAADLRRDYEQNVAIGTGERIVEGEVGVWVQALSNQAIRNIEAMKVIGERVLNQAANTEDVAAICYGARQLTNAYRDCLEWAARIRRAHVPADWEPVLREEALFLEPVLRELETFGSRLRASVEEALRKPGAGPHVVALTLNLSIADTARFYAEMEKLRKKRGLRGWAG